MKASEYFQKDIISHKKIVQDRSKRVLRLGVCMCRRLRDSSICHFNPLISTQVARQNLEGLADGCWAEFGPEALRFFKFLLLSSCFQHRLHGRIYRGREGKGSGGWVLGGVWAGGPRQTNNQPNLSFPPSAKVKRTYQAHRLSFCQSLGFTIFF